MDSKTMFKNYLKQLVRDRNELRDALERTIEENQRLMLLQDEISRVTTMIKEM